MRRLQAALQFLTLLPAGRTVAYDPLGMIPYFPIVGLILGALVSLFDRCTLGVWPASVVSLLDLLLLAGLTGAFHLDGLGDTADGLWAHRSRERSLAIMKDSRIGAMGLTAVVAALSLKWAGISSLPPAHRALLLILVPAFARGAMLFAIRKLPYGRPGGGTGARLFDQTLPYSAFYI